MIGMIDVQFWNALSTYLVDSTCLEPTSIFVLGKLCY